jgi:chromosome segregation ATPase
MEQQSLLIEAQAKELDGLRQQLSLLQADIRRTDDYPGMVEKARRDLTSSLNELKEQVRRDKAETERMRRSEIELLNQEISELDKKIRPLFRYEEALQAREAGEQRLQARVQQITQQTADLEKRLEDRMQSVVYLEEQRRADNRRISALEGDLPPLRQGIEEIKVKQVRLEDSVRKLPARVEEAIEIAKSYDPKIEALRVADFQREQRMKQYAEQAEEVEEEVARLVEQTQKYALLYNENKQALEALETFRARLERRQNEISEMQRLNEERLKREWEEWQATFARDWQKRLVTEEDRWRRQDLSNQKFVEHLAELDEQGQIYFEELLALWEEMRGSVERWGKAIQETVVPNQETPTQRLKELRRFAEERRKDLL